MAVKFATIYERASERKGGEAALRQLLEAQASAADLMRVTDDRCLSLMARAVFQSGFVWRVIADKWPNFERVFAGFDVQTLLSWPTETWEVCLSDASIVRHGKKIMSIRENALMIEEVAREKGSFARFLGEYDPADQINLFEFLKKKGSRLGGNSGQWFLRTVGYDAFILSGDGVRALRDAGLELSAAVTSKKDMQIIQKQMNIWQEETGLPYSHLSKILAFSIGENYRGMAEASGSNLADALDEIETIPDRILADIPQR